MGNTLIERFVEKEEKRTDNRTEFVIDFKNRTIPFPHYWEKCVGSCHALLGLREDWRNQLKKAHDELGFKYVRFHGLLNDEMSVCVRNSWHEGIKYISFHNIDLIFDFLLKIGMKPFVELSFMPGIIASGKETAFHYKGNATPPKNYKDWSELIERLVKHLVNRYGRNEVRSWYFEVWNEPNEEYFWKGTQEEYFLLYRYSAEAIKRVDKDIPVGGPASSRNAWIPEMIEYCRKNKVALDFISTHNYPNGPAWGLNMDLEKSLSYSGRGILTKLAIKNREEAGALPLFFTEWNCSANYPDVRRDESYAAAFAIKTIVDNQGLVDIYSFWTFSDIFEEDGLRSEVFHEGYGLLNIHGIPKPVYRAFQLLHGMGTERLPVESKSENTCEVLATRNEGELKILCYNHNVPLSPIKEEEISIVVKKMEITEPVIIKRIDDNNANPRKRWIEMGKPEYPCDKTILELMKNSEMSEEVIRNTNIDGDIMLTLKIPPHGVAEITLKKRKNC